MNLADIQKRVLASSSKKYLLDEYPNAAAAYSLRKLRSGYTGNCIEVRRSSDNTTQNIGFVNDVLDTASLLSFVGAGNGFVRTWYDQSGNGRNAFQLNTNQPRIVTSGVLQTLNNKPVIKNPTANQGNNLNINLSTLQPLPVTLIFAGKIDQLATNAFGNFSCHLGGSVNIGGGSRYELASRPLEFLAIRRDATLLTTKSPFSTTAFIQQGIFRTSELAGRQNGTDATPVSYSGSVLNSSSTFRIITGQNPALCPAVSAYEYIFYFSDQHSNRAGIESNINSYYNIY